MIVHVIMIDLDDIDAYDGSCIIYGCTLDMFIIQWLPSYYSLCFMNLLLMWIMDHVMWKIVCSILKRYIPLYIYLRDGECLVLHIELSYSYLPEYDFKFRAWFKTGIKFRANSRCICSNSRQVVYSKG